MLELARASKAPGLRFEEGNALELAYPDGSFDAVTVGFGARNFADLDRGLARDGARHAAGRPRRRPRDHDAAEAAAVAGSSALWFDRVVPAARPARRRPGRLHVPARAACGGSRDPAELGGRMAAAGLADVRWMLTAGGIIAIHSGTKA